MKKLKFQKCWPTVTGINQLDYAISKLFHFSFVYTEVTTSIDFNKVMLRCRYLYGYHVILLISHYEKYGLF